MNFCLDRFSRPLHMEALHHMNTCRDCNRIIPEGQDYCRECEHINWSAEIAGMKLSEFSKRLADVFEGEERDFDIQDGLVEFTYHCREQDRLEQARSMLDAYGAKCIVTVSDITFSLTAKSRGYGAVEMDLA